MKKKLILICAAVLMVFAILFGNHLYQKSIGNNDFKTVTIIMNKEGEEFFQKEIPTTSGTLEELLIEARDNKELMLEYQDSEFGMYITGLGNEELYVNDDSEKLYWTYSSDNNKTCLKESYCPGASSLEISDGDVFVFDYTKFE